MSEINLTVPYIVHESAQARAERMNKRLLIALIITIALLFASNAYWLYSWTLYDYTGETTETVTVDGSNGIAAYANHGGSVTNGTDNSKDDPDPNAHP